MRAALPSGMPATYAMSLTRPFDVASDGTNVYFSLSNANGAIVRGAIGGGNFRAIATPSAPGCIAVDQTSVYWLAGAPNNTGMVYKGPK
jgi:hypothetical protein